MTTMFQRTSFNNNMWLAAAVGALLVACGSGGSDGDTNEGGGSVQAPIEQPAAAKVEGVFAGTLGTGADSATFTALVLENGEMWSLYGDLAPSGVFAVNGFLQGMGSDLNGTYTSSNLIRFAGSQAQAASVTAQYASKEKTLRGSYTIGTSTVVLDGSPFESNYQYDTPAIQDSVVGRWTVTTLDGDKLTLEVSPTGEITPLEGQGYGCTAGGSLKPRVTGKNVFDITLAFGGEPCRHAATAFYGVAVSYNLSNGLRQLILAGHGNNRTVGLAAVGTR